MKVTGYHATGYHSNNFLSSIKLKISIDLVLQNEDEIEGEYGSHNVYTIPR